MCSNDSGRSKQNSLLEGFADELFQAFQSKQFERKGSVPIATLTLDQAYTVQSLLIERRIKLGERPVGYKVGCTSRSIRRQFGLEEPVLARLMSPHVYFGASRLNLGDYVRCAVEAELVFHIGRDIEAGFTRSDMASAIQYVSPGIEVHNYKFWYGKPTTQELIASNAIHACLVVGRERTRPDVRSISYSHVFSLYFSLSHPFPLG